MKVGKFVPICMLVALINPLVAQAKTIKLQPSSAWNLHYDNDSCVLRRAFGNHEQFVQIELRQFAPLTTFQVAAFGKGIKALNQIDYYRFGPSRNWRKTSFFAGSFRDEYLGGFFPMSVTERNAKGANALSVGYARNTAARDFAAAGLVNSIDLRGYNGDIVKLETGPLDESIKVMIPCLNDLVSRWGLDPELQANLRERPIPLNHVDVARALTFPKEMLDQGQTGIVNVRLDVGADGSILKCHVQLALSDSIFEREACRHLQTSLRFNPALDTEGNAVASYWTTTVNFRSY